MQLRYCKKTCALVSQQADLLKPCNSTYIQVDWLNPAKIVNKVEFYN